MITINYGPWVPDLSNNVFFIPDQDTPADVPVVDCLNLCYVNGTYRSVLPPVSTNVPTLAAQCYNAITFRDTNGVAIPVFGLTNGKVYYSGTSTSVSLLLDYSANLGNNSGWNIVQFAQQIFSQGIASQVYAINPGNLIYTVPGGSTAGTTVSGAPYATVIGVVGQFVMVGDLAGTQVSQTIGTGNAVTTNFTGTITGAPLYPTSILAGAGAVSGSDNGLGVISGTGISGTINYDTGFVSLTFTTPPGIGIAVTVSNAPAYRARLQWSPIGNPGTTWPTPLTNAAITVQSGIQDLEYAYGPVMFISGYPLYGVIFQRNAITRAQYIGANVVFQWQTFARNQGLLAKGAAVQVGANTYFLSDAGFFYTDGANVVPIGTTEDNSAGMDQWFFTNVNKNAYGAIRAGYDASMRAACFAIPTGSNTLPDTLLTYNVVARRWCKSAISSEMVWTDTDGTNNRLGVINQSHVYQLLTGTPSATAYLESADLGFTDGNVRTTTAIRPNVNGTSPSVVIGNRNTLNGSITYSASSTPDAFGGGFAGIFGESLYTRVRVSSTNAQAINGATCDMVPGGPI